MNGLRKSARVNTSTINVKLNDNNEIEFLTVRSDDEDDEDEAEDDEEEEEEELIENADGSLSIKITEKKPKPKRLPLHHICAKCSKVFSTPASLKRHLNLCKNLPKDDVTLEKEEFDLSSMIDLNDPVYDTVCFCCNEDKTTAHYGHVSCNFCPKSFKSHVSLERHLALLHSAEKQFICTTCNATCPTQDILEAHLFTHGTGSKPFSCQFCGKDFTRKYHLDRHLQYTSCDKSRKKTETACHVCGKSFSRMDNLREHLRAHIGQSTRKRDYQCPHCDKSFYGSSLLNIHIRTHTGEKPFLCDLCEKSFPSNGALRKHRRSHTGEKPYTCRICLKSFSAKETLNRHNKTHTGERPYSCDFCDKSFIQATQLRSHLFHHTGENGVSCDICGAKFSRKNRLESHIKEVHLKSASKNESPAKELGCTTCEEKFSTKAALQTHQKTHDEELHKCHICVKVYKNPNSFKRHMIKKHSLENKDVDSMDIDCGESIQIVKEETKEPNTYKIICDRRESPTRVIPDAGRTCDTIYEIYEFNDEEILAPKQESTGTNNVDPYETELKENIVRLLKSVVDDDVLTKFGFPFAPVENVLCSVIEQCGQVPVDVRTCSDSITKLRENVKILFTSVIGDDSIKEMLNNHTIDEVISHVIKLSDK